MPPISPIIITDGKLMVLVPPKAFLQSPLLSYRP